MGSRRLLQGLAAALLTLGALCVALLAQSSPPSSSSSSKHVRKPAAGSPSDAGSVRDGVYRNQALGITCKIPPGWVLRTEEMNARDEEEPSESEQIDQQKDRSAFAKAAEKDPAKIDERVLLAAFSRPPQATGEDVNSSILIAAESMAAYPGLKEAAQYFGPVTEIAQGQGFAVVNEPYEFPVGAKSLVRGDFQKNVASLVMRQSTLVMLAHGHAVSITFIAGTEEELEDLVNGLSFAPPRNTGK